MRRELIRVRSLRGLRNLDRFKSTFEYFPITTETMLLAADLWAKARQTGQPTAPDRELDADMILAAQACILEQAEQDTVIIATTNVGHLSRFAAAQLWPDITVPLP